VKPSVAYFLLGLGCFATASQVHVIREFLALFSSNELCLGVIFLCWLAGVGIGALLAGKIKHSPTRSKERLLFSGTLLVVLLPVMIFVLRSFRGLLSVQPGVLPGFYDLVAAGWMLIVPFSFFIGLSFPFACSFAAQNNESPTIGRVYVLESCGAIAGGIATSVLMAGSMTLLESVTITAIPLLMGMAWIGFSVGSSKISRSFGTLHLVSTLLALLLLSSGFTGRVDDRTAGRRFNDLKSGGKRVAWTDTPYAHLDLAEQEGQYTLFSNGKVLTTFPDPYRSRPRAHLVLTEHPAPKKVLYLGSNAIEFLPFALEHPLERLDIVALDPLAWKLILPYLDGRTRSRLSDPRVVITFTDAPRFLRESHERWDLIFSDAADPATAFENRLFTLGFFERIHAHLAPQGVFVTRLSSSFTVLDETTRRVAATLYNTLGRVFAQTKVLPGGETFFLASDALSVLLDDPGLLSERYRSTGLQDQAFSPEQFSMLFEHEKIPEVTAQLIRNRGILANTDDQPIVYLQSIVRWSRMTESGFGKALQLVLSIPAWGWFLLLLAGAAFVFLILLFRPFLASLAARRAASLSIGAIGALGISLELVLTFDYQSRFGSLYREMGWIVAAFMLGLVLGGTGINRVLTRRKPSLLLLGIVLLAIGVFTFFVPLFLSADWLDRSPLWAGQAFLLLLILFSGFGTGVVFPLASQLSLASGLPMEKAAGSLDAVDHFGAAAGALLTGVFLVPAIGRFATCSLLCLLLLLAGAFSLAVWSKSKYP
jgi:spermidine synthase